MVMPEKEKGPVVATARPWSVLSCAILPSLIRCAHRQRSSFLHAAILAHDGDREGARRTALCGLLPLEREACA
jgi:hypothetical protein